MRPRYPAIVRMACATAVIAGAAGAEPIQSLMETPQPLSLQLTRPKLMLDVEGSEFLVSREDHTRSDDRTLDWTPSAGLGMNGSIYHPKLFEFDVYIEGGLTRGRRHVDDGYGNTQDSDHRFTIGQYRASATLLRDKPYSITFFGAKGRTERTYDQFNRFDADTEEYGAALRGRLDTWNWSVRASHSDEQLANADRPSRYEEDFITVDAQNQRRGNGQTSVRYDNRHFLREEGDTPAYSGVQQSLFITDQAYTTTNQNTRLLSSLAINDLSESLLDSRTLSWGEDYRQEHRPTLWSGAIYRFERRESGDADYQSHNGELYGEHRLYQNLDSRLNLQAERDEGESDRLLRYGPGLDERYTRRLGDAGRVSMTLGGRYDRISQSSAGSQTTVVGEALRLDDQRPAFLSVPNVQPATVIVTDVSRTRRYLAGFDYRVVPRGAFTEIQRVFGGAIPAGTTVLVDYVADTSQDDTLDRWSGRTGFDLDLFDRRLYLYGQFQAADSLGARSLTYEDYRDSALGLKSRWSWFEVGGERNSHAADTLSYDGHSYYAELFWDGDETSLTLHAGRSILDYRDQLGRVDARTYSATFSWHPVSALTAQAFAGQHHEQLRDGDRDLVTLEARLAYRFAHLTVDGTYRHENESYSQTDYERHYLFIRVVRDL